MAAAEEMESGETEWLPALALTLVGANEVTTAPAQTDDPLAAALFAWVQSMGKVDPNDRTSRGVYAALNRILRAASIDHARLQAERALRSYPYIAFAEIIASEVTAIARWLGLHGPTLHPPDSVMFGDVAMARLHHAATMSRSAMEIVTRLHPAIVFPSREQPIREPIDVALSAEVPSTVRSILLAHLRGVVMSIALVFARRKNCPIRHDLAEHLAADCESGIGGVLRLLASVRGAEVSPEIVPPNERLDLPAIYRKARRARAVALRDLHEAEKAGFPPYPATR